jgi:N-acetylmuramoyl-L-alanine amidase
MTNSKDLAYITSERGKKEIATAIADAIMSFFQSLDAISSDADGEDDTTSSDAVVADGERLERGYAIQLISSTCEVDTKDYQFKSYKGKVYLLMGTGRYKYKYCYGSYSSREAAKADLSEAQKTFKDAYIVYYEGDNIVTK